MIGLGRRLLLTLLAAAFCMSSSSADACTTATVTVATAWPLGDYPPAATEELLLIYPDDLVEIPGTGSGQSVVARATLLASAPGALFGVSDVDVSGDEPHLKAALVAVGDLPQGDFIRIILDCLPAAPAPTPSDFSCIISTTTVDGGAAGPPTCSIALTLD